MLSKAFTSTETTVPVKTLVPTAGVFPLSGFSNLRTVQDARRYLATTRELLAHVRTSPSGVPLEVRMPLDDAWFHVNVGLSLVDGHLRLGRTWFDWINNVPGLREALNGMVRAFAHAKPSWRNWDKERNVTAAMSASMTKLQASVESTSSSSSSSSSSGSSSSANATKSAALSGLNDLTKPTTTATYLGLGLATLGAWLLWSFSK